MNSQRLMIAILLPVAIASTSFASADDTTMLHWHVDYAAAMKLAENENKNVLSYFHAAELTAAAKACDS